MKHKLAVFGLFVGCATGGAFAALPSITISDFEISGNYQCDATGDGNMWTFADSLSSVTNVTLDANGNPVGLLVNDPDGSVSGDGYARLVVHECENTEYGCAAAAGFGIGFGKDLSKTYADSEDAVNYGGRKIYDLTGLDSIDFWVKGTIPRVDSSDTNGYWRIQLQSPLFNRNTFTNRSSRRGGYDNNYGYNIPKSRLKANTWVHIAIPVDSLTLWYEDPGWENLIEPSKDLVLQYVTGVEFVGVGSSDLEDPMTLDGEIEVDNLRFVGLSALNPQEGIIPTLVSGNVDSNTTWGPGLYYVMGNVSVYDTLTIEPGTRVVFQGNYSLNVAQTRIWDGDSRKYCSGALVARGTAADSIYFTAADTSAGWGGLRFNVDFYFSMNGADAIGGDIRYASFSYGKNGDGGCLYLNYNSYDNVTTDTTSVSVADSRFSRCTANGNGGAIYNENSRLSISGSTFDGSTASGNGGAIYNTGNLKLSRSQFFRNSGNDAVLSNWEGGTTSISSSLFAFNMARNSEYSGDVWNGGSLNILNSTFVGDSYASGYAIVGADTVVNSIVLGGTIIATYTSHNFTTTEGALATIAFVDSANGDFRLSGTSPAVNVGTSENVVLDSLDLAGNPRVAMGTVDIGAYERKNTAPVKSSDFAEVLSYEDASPYAVTLGGTSVDLDLSKYFSDLDKVVGDSLRITSVSSGSTKFALLWNAATGSLTLTPAADSNGTDTILVTVADIDGATASAKMPFTLAPRNDAPTITASPIPLMTDQDTTFNLSSFFADIDAGDELTYSAVLKKNVAGTLTAAANGITLTIPKTVSDTLKDTVTVTVTDDSAATATLAFPLWTVPVDHAPELDLAFHDTTADEDAPDRVLSLNDHFSDPDANTIMTYSAISLQGKLSPSVSIAAGDTSLVLKFVANRNGTDSVVVTASDGLKSVRDTFTVAIRSINDAPVISDSIKGLVKDEDFGDTAIDLSKHFLDVDGSLSYSAKTDLGKVSVAVEGSRLTISAIANAFGTDSITVTAADDSAASVSEKFAIAITPEDDAPVLTPIPDFAVPENTKDTLDLSKYYTEVDGQPLTYSVVSVDNETNGAVVNGNKTSIIPGTAKLSISLFSGATGSNAVTVSATDGTTAVPATFNVVVSEVNAAPTRVTTIPDVLGSEGDQIEMGALTEYFSDDGGVTNLTFSTVSDNEEIVSVINGESSAPTLSLNASGTAKIIVTATDAGDLSAKDTLQVSVNGAPVITSTAPAKATEDEKYSYTVEASDAEGSALTYSLENAPEGMTIADNVISWTPQNGVLTSGEVTLRVSDGETSTTQKFTVTVTPVNDAPVATSAVLASTTLKEEGSLALGATEIASLFSDPDGDALTYTLSSTSKKITVDNSKKTITGVKDSSGIATIALSASDGTLSVSRTFTLTITPVNDAPVATSAVLASTTLKEEGSLALGATEIASLFSDPDGDALTYTLSSTSKKITVDNSKKTITGVKDSSGTATIALSASDGTLSVSRTFTLTITPVNDAPVATSAVLASTTFAEEGTLSLSATEIASLFTDADGDALAYALTSTSKKITVDNSKKTITGVKDSSGTATITLSASDGKLSVSRTFTLTITPVNDAPVIASVKKDTTDENVPIRLTMSILTATDVDNKASELSLVIGTNSHYTVSGDTVKPAKNYTGTLSVPVRVTDGKDTSAVDTVEITVLGTTAIAAVATHSSGRLTVLGSGGFIRLSYSTAQTADVTIGFYNLSGMKVLTLREGMQNAGMHEASDNASALKPGFYVGVLELNGTPVSKTKVLIRR